MEKTHERTSFNITECETITGYARRTLYNHKDNGKVSFSEDDDGNVCITKAELERVYGFEKIAKGLMKLQEEKESDKSSRDKSSVKIAQSNSVQSVQNSVKKSQESSEEVAVLRERVARYQAESEMHKAERERERKQLEAEIENLRESLKKSQEQNDKSLLLLTSTKTPDEQSKETLYKKRYQQAMKALQEEKKKTFLQRVMGK